LLSSSRYNSSDPSFSHRRPAVIVVLCGPVKLLPFSLYSSHASSPVLTCSSQRCCVPRGNTTVYIVSRRNSRPGLQTFATRSHRRGYAGKCEPTGASIRELGESATKVWSKRGKNERSAKKTRVARSATFYRSHPPLCSASLRLTQFHIYRISSTTPPTGRNTHNDQT